MFHSWLLFVVMWVILFAWRDVRKPKGFPPGPRWLPLIGSLLAVIRLQKVYAYYHEIWHHFARYGPVVGLRLGSERFVYVSGRNAVRELLTARTDEFDGRPTGFFFRVRSFGRRLGIVFVDGAHWEEQRKFVMQTLRQLGMGRTEMVDHVEREAAELVRHFRTISDHGRASINLNTTFDVAVLNVMWTMMAGHRYEFTNTSLPKLMQLIDQSFQACDMSGGLLNQFPFLRFVMPNRSGYRPLVSALKPLWQFLRDEIATLRAKRAYKDGEKANSLIEAYLQEIDKRPGSAEFTEEQLLVLCLDLFQAGSETTSSTLSFAIIYLLNNPDCLRRIRTELDSVIGDGRLPTLSDRSALHFTEAFLCETLRLANVAPLAIAHRTLRAATLGGFEVPADTVALISLHSVHMDPDYWHEPHHFRPDRFLGEDDTGHTCLIKHDNFLPFGAGRRRCMGEKLAKSSLFLFFASLVQAFDIDVPAGDPMPDHEHPIDGITLSPRPFCVTLLPRMRFETKESK